MLPRDRRPLVVTLAVLLVLVPIWAPALDVPTTRYEYHAVELDVDDTGKLVLDYPGNHTTPFRGHYGDVSGIDCFPGTGVSRACLFEGGTLDGTITGTQPGAADVTNPDFIASGADYVVLDRTFYRRTATRATETESNASFELGLERTDAAVALDAVALTHVGDDARTAIRAGHLTTDDELGVAHRVLELDDRYYVVYQTDESAVQPVSSRTARFLEGLSVLVGVVLLLLRE